MNDLNNAKRTSLQIWRRTLGVGLLSGLTLLTSCTGGDAKSEPSDDEAIDTGLAFASPDADDFNKELDSRDDLSDIASVEVLAVDEIDSQILTVAFEMPSHECHGISASSSESENEVVISVKSGLLPERQAADCLEGSFPYTTNLALESPLGDRTVVLAEEQEPEPLESADAPTSGEEAPVETEDEGLEQFVGRHVEDGVAWAIANEMEWRIVSQDGEPVESDTPAAAGTVGFVVEADIIVSYEVS